MQLNQQITPHQFQILNKRCSSSFPPPWSSAAEKLQPAPQLRFPTKTHTLRSLRQRNTRVHQHEVFKQPRREPPDGASWVRAGHHGQRGLGEPWLLWIPSTPAPCGEHHLQPAAPFPGVHGKRIQTGTPGPDPGGTGHLWPACDEEEKKRLLFFHQRWERILPRYKLLWAWMTVVMHIFCRVLGHGVDRKQL